MTGKEISNMQEFFRKKIENFVLRKDNDFLKTLDIYIKNENKGIITSFLSFYGLTVKNDKDRINRLINKNIDLFKEYIKTVLCIKDVDVFYRNRYRSNGKLTQEIAIGFDIEEEMIAAYSMLSAIEKNRK